MQSEFLYGLLSFNGVCWVKIVFQLFILILLSEYSRCPEKAGLVTELRMPARRDARTMRLLTSAKATLESASALRKQALYSEAKFLIAVNEPQLALRRDVENSADLLC
jgi:hypothetical protein